MIDSAIRQDLKYLVLACRPYQWIKNIIVFFPLFFGKHLFHTDAIPRTTCMFVVFCLIASSGYLLNDLGDYQMDIHHPDKSKRPFASDRVSRRNSILCATLLALSGLLLTYIVCRELVWMITAYLILSGCYNLWLKKIVIIDLVCIAAFYLLRILSGSESAGVIPSVWLVWCTVLLSNYLGLAKRYVDCRFAGTGNKRCEYYGTLNAKRMVHGFALALFLFYFVYITKQLDGQILKLLMAGGTVLFAGGGIVRYEYQVFGGKYSGDAIMLLFQDRWLQLLAIGWLVLTGLNLYIV